MILFDIIQVVHILGMLNVDLDLQRICNVLLARSTSNIFMFSMISIHVIYFMG